MEVNQINLDFCLFLQNKFSAKLNFSGIDKAVEEALIRIKDGRLSLDLKSYKNLAGIHPNQANSSNVDWVFMTSALNFSFWNLENEPQYLVTYKGKTQNGYMSM